MRDHVDVCKAAAGSDALDEQLQSRSEGGERVAMHQHQRRLCMDEGLDSELRFRISRAVEPKL